MLQGRRISISSYTIHTSRYTRMRINLTGSVQAQIITLHRAHVKHRQRKASTSFFFTAIPYIMLFYFLYIYSLFLMLLSYGRTGKSDICTYTYMYMPICTHIIVYFSTMSCRYISCTCTLAVSHVCKPQNICYMAQRKNI